MEQYIIYGLQACLAVVFYMNIIINFKKQNGNAVIGWIVSELMLLAWFVAGSME